MTSDDLRVFLFRGLMFESEADEFQRAGIQVGAQTSAEQEALLTEQLTPFSIQRRNAALEMSRIYSLLYCFENEVREFIRERLSEIEGQDWFSKLPTNIIKAAETRRNVALKDSWLEGQKTDLLGFADFWHLSQIIIAKWDCFKDVIPTQHWLSQRFDEIEKARNFIAHNRILQPGEFARLYMYVNDWNKVVGF